MSTKAEQNLLPPNRASPSDKDTISTQLSKKENSICSIGKEITIENKMVAVFVSYYMGWSVSCHPAAILILDYSGVYKQDFSPKRQWWLYPIIETTFSEATKILLTNNKSLLPLIRDSNFDVYVRYCSTCHSNYDMGYAWFLTLDTKSQVKLFTEYSLNELSQLLHITSKNKANFMKSLSGIDVSARASGYISWHTKYKEIRSSNAKTRKLW